MSTKNHSESPGLFRTAAYCTAIAIIVVNVLRSILRTLVRTHEGITESRNRRAA